MSIDWNQVAHEYVQNLPSPHDPTGQIPIKEWATAVKLATAAKFGGHASPHEAALFYPEFKATGMHPQEFEAALERLAPLSFTYHGRPPSMQEIVQLKDKSPAEARKYFGDLPHKIYPHVSAHDMVAAVQAAKPHAQEHLGREPSLNEAAYLHHSKERPAEYFQRIAQSGQSADKLPSNVIQAGFRGNSGDGGVQAPRGQAVGQ
jgi:hypothetical protein